MREPRPPVHGVDGTYGGGEGEVGPGGEEEEGGEPEEGSGELSFGAVVAGWGCVAEKCFWVAD